MDLHVHARWTRGLMVGVVALATVSACSKEKKESSGDVTPAATATTPAASTVAVTDIDIGKAAANSRVTSTLFTVSLRLPLRLLTGQNKTVGGFGQMPLKKLNGARLG